jgi:hypothetical protein
MTLANRSTSRLGGSTGGLLRVDPDPRSNRIRWGGSSADELWQKPGSVTQREVGTTADLRGGTQWVTG